MVDMYATRIAEGDMLAAVFSAEREAASGAGRRGTRGAPRDRRGAGVASALGRWFVSPDDRPMIRGGYDADYDTIAEITGQPVRWAAPRGSL